MPRLALLFLLLLSLVPCLAAQKPSLPLPNPERLLYRISCSGWLTLGFAEMRIKGRTQEQGVDCYVFETRTWAADWLKGIYPVDDLIQSHWDPKKRRTLWHYKRIKEGRLDQEYEVRFDYPKQTAYWKQRGFSPPTTKNQATGEIPIPPSLQDPLSTLYLARSWQGEVVSGLQFNLQVFDDLKIASIAMEIGKKEELKVKINRQKTTRKVYQIEPHMEGTGLFKRKGERLFIWVEQTGKRLPVRIQSDIPIGSIRAELIEVSPTDFNSPGE